MSSKFNEWLHRSRGEKGQAMVMVALSMVVILGFAAFAVDISHVAVQKSELQNAADAAALAGVVEITSNLVTKKTAEDKAVEYAHSNGMSAVKNGEPLHGDTVSATATLATKQLRVECTRTVEYYFAGVLGFKSTEVKAVAVAKKNIQYDGEALPFINLDDAYGVGNKIVIWESLKNGDFESLDKNESEWQPTGEYFKVFFSDGIESKKGRVATVKQEVKIIFDRHKPVYIFSLSSSAMNLPKYQNIRNNVVVPLSDVVLLQASFDEYDYQAKKLKLTVTGVYDVSNGVFPTDFLNNGSTGSAKLVE